MAETSKPSWTKTYTGTSCTYPSSLENLKKKKKKTLNPFKKSFLLSIIILTQRKRLISLHEPKQISVRDVQLFDGWLERIERATAAAKATLKFGSPLKSVMHSSMIFLLSSLVSFLRVSVGLAASWLLPHSARSRVTVGWDRSLDVEEEEVPAIKPVLEVVGNEVMPSSSPGRGWLCSPSYVATRIDLSSGLRWT